MTRKRLWNDFDGIRAPAVSAVLRHGNGCNATRQDKGRRRGNLKQAVKSFIEWLNSRAAVNSAERIKIEDYRGGWDQKYLF